MGMDVYGHRPTGDKGKYFGESVWGWHPLWDFCYEHARDIIPIRVFNDGHMNVGASLKAKQARDLAARLRDLIESGKAQEYCKKREEKLKALPDETCEICAGTGFRKPPPNLGAGDYPCNGCGGAYHDGKPGTGKVRPHETHYQLYYESIVEFAEFCEASGGFKIL